MEMNSLQFEKFKIALDQGHTWPSPYTFKFIIKETELPLAQQVFEGEELILKGSSTGKYVSVTLIKNVHSSDEVILLYKRASIIPGIISL